MRIVLASNNPGKLAEFVQLIDSAEIELIPQSDFQMPAVTETGLTYVENAILKARHASQISGLPAIGDDSGIEVDCLQGQPGIYSARFAGETATAGTNIDKLLSALQDYPALKDRTARFVCVIVLLRHALDPSPIIAEGFWSGQILLEKTGSHGFGYDPIFYLPDKQCSAAELPEAEKNHISHRGQAFAKLLAALRLEKNAR